MKKTIAEFDKESLAGNILSLVSNYDEDNDECWGHDTAMETKKIKERAIKEINQFLDKYDILDEIFTK